MNRPRASTRRRFSTIRDSLRDSWAKDLLAHSAAVRDLLTDSLGPEGQNIVDALEKSYTDVSFHLASALGGRVSGPSPVEEDRAPAENNKADGSKSAKQEELGPTNLFEFTPMTLAGVVEPFARALWAARDAAERSDAGAQRPDA